MDNPQKESLLRRMVSGAKNIGQGLLDKNNESTHQYLSDLKQATNNPFDKAGIESGRRITDQSSDLAMGTISGAGKRLGDLQRLYSSLDEELRALKLQHGSQVYRHPKYKELMSALDSVDQELSAGGLAREE